MKSTGHKLLLANIVMIICSLSLAPFSKGVSLAWDQDTSPGIVGYRLYYGPASGGFTTMIEVGNVTTASVSGLLGGVSYNFAVTAYDSSGLESLFSNEIQYTVPSVPNSGASGGSTSGYITSENEGLSRNGFSGFLGMQIVVNSPITVTQLGRMMSAGNTGTHVVKLVHAGNGTDVSGGSVTVTMSGGTVGQFQYASLPAPIVLPAGNAYYVVSQETSGGDYWFFDNTTVQTTSVASETAGVWSDSSGQWHTDGGPGQAYGPVDFRYDTSAPVVTTTTPPPVVTPPPAAPQPFVTSFEPGLSRNGFTGFLGMQIVVGSDPLTVTALGRMAWSGDSQTHTVKFVYASTGADVPGGSVSVSMSGGTVGQFVYANLSSPIVLSSGTTYYLVSQETNGGDTFLYDNTTITTTSDATETSAVWGNTGNWHLDGSAGQTYGPLDFKYTDP